MIREMIDDQGMTEFQSPRRYCTPTVSSWTERVLTRSEGSRTPSILRLAHHYQPNSRSFAAPEYGSAQDDKLGW